MVRNLTLLATKLLTRLIGAASTHGAQQALGMFDPTDVEPAISVTDDACWSRWKYHRWNKQDPESVPTSLLPISKLNVILIFRESISEGRPKLALSSRSFDKSQHRPQRPP